MNLLESDESELFEDDTYNKLIVDERVSLAWRR